MSEEKKTFKETKFGKFLNKAGKSLPSILAVGGELLTGDVGGAIDKVGQLLKGGSTNNPEVQKLLQEFELNKMQYEKDVFALEVQDRDSARNREIEVAKTGKKDYMMTVVGVVGLLVFMFCVYAVVYVPSVKDNDIFIHLLGMVEGAVLTIFAYYFGTSKSSADKNDMIKK